MKRQRLVAASLAVGLVLTACGGGGDDGAEEPVAEETGGEGEGEGATAAEGEPISVGFLGELSGPFAIWGVHARNGMQMAIDEINAAGGVDGRPFELIERDTQGTPEEGVTAFRGLIERDGVVFAGGLISSDVALSASRIAEESQVPLFLVKAGADAILTQDSRYTFRTCLSAGPMNIGLMAQFIQAEGITRVGAIIADYAWGRSIEAAINDQIATLDGVEVQIQVAPVPETDFTTYLRQLEALDPEIIIATGHPPGSGPITSQAADLGFDAYVTGANSPLAAVMQNVGDSGIDRYVDYTCADIASEEYYELARRYQEQFDSFMEDDAVAGYGQVHMVAEAIEATGSAEPADIAEYLRGNSFDLPGYAFDMEWTEWGEMSVAQPLLFVVREQEAPEGVNPGNDWYPEVLFQAEPLEPFEP
jgi:branched-chain amino acid transport system substrate-binding protein